jgi:hypothetical protein
MRGMRREPADIAVFTLRLREKLRDQLEREAKKHQTSMNDEIIRRLEDSLRGEDLAEVVKAAIKSTMDLRPAVALLKKSTMELKQALSEGRGGEEINRRRVVKFKEEMKK